MFNDRLLLGMKGTMSEAELHILRARLDGGIRTKAARGELRCGLPVGLVWGEGDGQVLPHPDEAVRGVIAAIFAQFPLRGSVRGVWLWLRDQGLKLPLHNSGYVSPSAEIVWVDPTYHAVHNILTHPAYAGAYTFGRTRQEKYVGDDGALRVRRRVLPRAEWAVCITDHHQGFIDWDTYLANQARIGANIRPTAHQPGTGAVREGCALLQGLVTCGVCGRKLAVYYDGEHKATPGYYCTGTGQLVEGRGTRHLRVGGVAIDAAVTTVFLAALAPAALQACLAAAQQLEHGRDAALEQWRRQVETARYQASKAERRYRAVDPENRLVARGLEKAWEHALQQLADAEAELARRESTRPKTLTAQEKSAILALGDNLETVWDAQTTTDRDRKQLLRTLLDEVTIGVHRNTTDSHAELVVRWKGGAISELTVPIKRSPINRLRTDEDTIDLVRRLAAHYPDATIAHILNRQGRRTARGLSFTASRVQSLRHYHEIACHTPTDDPQEAELLTVTDAAAELGFAPSTLHRWLSDGFIAGEQLTPGAPWRIRLTDETATCSSTTPPTAGWPCWRPPSPTVCPAKPSCNVSSAANSKPCTCAPDTEKACVSSPHPPRKDYFDHDNQRKKQCGTTSNAADRSASKIHTRLARDPLKRGNTGRRSRRHSCARDETRRNGVRIGLPTRVPTHYGPAPGGTDPSLRGYRVGAVLFHWPSEYTRAEPAPAPTYERERCTRTATSARASARQGGFPVDPGRSTPSVALGHLPHTHQRVRPRPQHQFLQRPNLSPVLLPRRLEDPAPQPRYVLLMGTPIDHVPVHDSDVLGSVHRELVSNLPLWVCETTGSLVCSKAHLPTSAPSQARPHQVGIRPVMPRRSTEVPITTGRGFPVAFRPPAFGSWASCPAEGFPSLSRSTYPDTPMASMFPGPRRGFHVPHTRYATGLGALFTPRPRCAHPSVSCPPGRRAPPLPGARSCHPGHHPIYPELRMTRRHQGFTHVHPPGLLPGPATPGWSKGPLRRILGLRTPPARSR